MSRPRFLADHDLTDAIVDGVLRVEPTAEFVRAREIGADRLPDDLLLQRAAAADFIVVSHDENTMSDAAYQRIGHREHMPGLFLVVQGTPVGQVIDSLVLIWAASEAEEWEDRVQYLPLR
jgi:hypothetical protein